MFALVQSLGRRPSDSEILNNLVSGSAMREAASFRSLLMCVSAFTEMVILNLS